MKTFIVLLMLVLFNMLTLGYLTPRLLSQNSDPLVVLGVLVLVGAIFVNVWFGSKVAKYWR